MEFPVENETTFDLFNRYAQYFVEDFATSVFSHLKATYPLSQDYINEFVKHKVGAFFSGTYNSGATPINVVTRFIQECVDYANDHDVEDPSDRSTWDYISSLPSIHHDEIQATIFASAILYNKTVDQTLVGVVMRDSSVSSDLIRNAIQAQSVTNETGGKLNVFNWGLLNDGIWLNGALLKTYELSNAFRPGDTIVSYYAKVCYDFSRSNCEYSLIPQDDIDNIEGYIYQAVSSLGADLEAEYAAYKDKFDYVKSLTYASELASYVEYWEKGFSNTRIALEAVTILSSTITVLNAIKDSTRVTSEDDDAVSIPDTIGDRINKMLDVLTLCLTGYEALRETKFSDTLIFDANKASDSHVEVYVNDDLIGTYRSAGGEDQDLIHLGMYIAADNLRVTPSDGWTLSWALARKDDIIAEVLSKQSQNQEDRDRDLANAVRNILIVKLSDVVNSYLESAGHKPFTPDITRKIEDIAAMMVTGSDVPLDDQVFGLLLYVTGNDFVKDTGERLIKYISSDNPEAKANALGLTVGETAIEDAIDFVIDRKAA